MTENEKNLALGLAKVKVDKLIDWYYTKRNPQLQHFDKEGLLGKIAFDLLELRGILDGCKYNPFDEQAKAMDEADKRKEAIQDEKELNPDTLTKEVNADNLEKISQRAEYNANDYIGHPFDEDEDTSITYARESYEDGFKQGWQEGETYGFDKGFDFCEQTNDIQHIKKEDMTKEEFIKEVTGIADRWLERFPELRRGQAIFNCVDDNYGPVARKVQHEDNVDCFYDDDLIDEFLDHCWEYLKEKI